MKYTSSISWFLGISMFMFGFLKFFNPFKEWYSVQISASGLDSFYTAGILGELFVGIAFILGVSVIRRTSPTFSAYTVVGTSVILSIMMGTAIYVHLHPSVPAEVLPLKIRFPFIPGFFLALGLINSVAAVNLRRRIPGS